MVEGREHNIKEFWDKSNFLNSNDKEYSIKIKSIIEKILKEDIGKGDITSNLLIDKDEEIKARIIAKEDGIIAGLEEISLIIDVKPLIKDGDEAKKGDVILEIEGNARKILSYERTILNILQRMSGIATITYKLNKLVEGKCFISATRKSIFPLLDKKAVSVGGGLTHRLNIEDSILIKDNHLSLLKNNIENALKLAINNKEINKIEIEVKNNKEAIDAVNFFINSNSEKMFALMFDNMSATEIKNSINEINNILDRELINNNKNKEIDLKNKILFEASGNIDEKNIKDYSESGVYVISMGTLTHSAKSLDISMEIE